MKSTISILGCGWLGLPLAANLITNGHLVNGSTTTPSKLPLLKAEGLDAHLIDIGKKDYKPTEFLKAETLIIAITSKNIEHFKTLIKHIEDAPIKNVIFISSTSVYPFTNSILNEDSETKDTPLRRIEELFLTNKTINTTIIRFGGLFGGSRKPGNFMKPGKIIDNPEGYINLIHLDDCIGLIEKIIASKTNNTIINGSADTHPTRREFYTKEVAKLGKPTPIFNEDSKSVYKIISNKKAKTLLNYTFKYSDLMNY